MLCFELLDGSSKILVILGHETLQLLGNIPTLLNEQRSSIRRGYGQEEERARAECVQFFELTSIEFRRHVGWDTWNLTCVVSRFMRTG